jgi:hypothetical protein
MLSSKRILTVLALLFSFNALAQFPFFHAFQDTFLPGDRISRSFDSVDLYVAEYQTTLPAWWRPAYQIFNPDNLSGWQAFSHRPFVFSAIAHVGLQYALGSNNTQRAGISYKQALSESQFVQMDYVRRSTSGAIRNSNLESNFLDLQYLIRRQRYAQKLQVLFDGDEQSLSGGLLNDSVREGFELIFSDVQNVSAGQRRRRFSLESANYFSFTADSALRTGVYLTAQLDIKNRLFTETNDFDTLYGNWLIDSADTYDHWEKSQIGGMAGYFFETRRFSVSGGVRVRYWDFDNLGDHYDTTETAIAGNLRLDPLPNLHLGANGEFNFAGAVGESALNAWGGYVSGKLRLGAKASFSSLYPELYQRHLHGNQYDYNWNTKQLVKRTNAVLEAAYSGREASVGATAGLISCQDLPFFLDNRWRQDTLTTFSILHFTLRGDVRLGRFFIQPMVRFQTSDLEYMPAVQLFGRMGFDGFLFKAKKLRAALGVEPGYISSYTLLDFVPYMGTYVLPGTAKQFNAMPKLSAFAQFELGFLRWFVRVENIEQVFVPVNYEALGYPHVPMQIRVGLSWDIFN